MDTITKDDFEDLLKYNINVIGIKKEAILENASIKIIKHIDLNMRDTFGVVCGVSDNGEYGLVIARNLVSLGKYVEIFVVETQSTYSKIFKEQLEIAKNIGIRINYLETIDDLQNFGSNIRRVNTIIDAITGIDYRGEFIGATEYIIDTINKSRIFTVSVDIPSGIDYDTGISKVQHIQSDIIVTFHKLKEALFFEKGLYDIKIYVENIGLIERG